MKLFWFAELVSAWDTCFLFPRHVECGLAGAGKAKNLAGTALRPIQTRLTTRALKKPRLFVKFTRRKMQIADSDSKKRGQCLISTHDQTLCVVPSVDLYRFLRQPLPDEGFIADQFGKMQLLVRHNSRERESHIQGSGTLSAFHPRAQ